MSKSYNQCPKHKFIFPLWASLSFVCNNKNEKSIAQILSINMNKYISTQTTATTAATYPSSSATFQTFYITQNYVYNANTQKKSTFLLK